MKKTGQVFIKIIDIVSYVVKMGVTDVFVVYFRSYYTSQLTYMYVYELHFVHHKM